jgi:hypothetical protein
MQWHIAHSGLPMAWRVEGLPSARRTPIADADGKVRLRLSLRTPPESALGTMFVARLSLVSRENRQVIQQREWVEVYDTVAPIVTNYRVIVLRDRRIGIQLTASDRHSDIHPQRVVTQFSLDGGHTWQSRRHLYKLNVLGHPSTFETIIGPFATGTRLLLRICAADVAGNVGTHIPREAQAFLAAPNSEGLLERQDRTDPEAETLLFAFEKQQNIIHQAARMLAYRTGDSAVDRAMQRRSNDVRSIATTLRLLRIDPFQTVPLRTKWYVGNSGQRGAALSVVEVMVP